MFLHRRHQFLPFVSVSLFVFYPSTSAIAFAILQLHDSLLFVTTYTDRPTNQLNRCLVHYFMTKSCGAVSTVSTTNATDIVNYRFYKFMSTELLTCLLARVVHSYMHALMQHRVKKTAA